MSGVKLIAGNCLIILQCHLVWQTLEREGSITITYLLQSQPISHPSLNWNRRPTLTRPSSKAAQPKNPFVTDLSTKIGGWGQKVLTNPDFFWGELNEPFPKRFECEVRVCVEIYDILTLLRNRFVITSMLLCLYCLISSLQTDNKLTQLSIFWQRGSWWCFEDPTVTVWFHI